MRKKIISQQELSLSIANESNKPQIKKIIKKKIIVEYRPPKDSLSELILNNEIHILEKYLKEDGVNPNIRDTTGMTSTWTPLYWSVKLNRIECVEILLIHGADINMVVNDFEECCGTVLDLATLRGDSLMEELLREHAVKEDYNLGQSFKAIRTKLRGKNHNFNFKYYGNKKTETT